MAGHHVWPSTIGRHTVPYRDISDEADCKCRNWPCVFAFKSRWRGPQHAEQCGCSVDRSRWFVLVNEYRYIDGYLRGRWQETHGIIDDQVSAKGSTFTKVGHDHASISIKDRGRILKSC